MPRCNQTEQRPASPTLITHEESPQQERRSHADDS